MIRNNVQRSIVGSLTVLLAVGLCAYQAYFYWDLHSTTDPAKALKASPALTPITTDLTFCMIIAYVLMTLFSLVTAVWPDQDFHWYYAAMLVLLAGVYPVLMQFLPGSSTVAIVLMGASAFIALCYSIPMNMKWASFLHPFTSD